MPRADVVETLAFLPRRALGLFDATLTRLEVGLERIWLRPPSYRPEPWEVVVDGLEARLGPGLRAFLAEPALADVERDVSRAVEDLSSRAPFPLVYNADVSLARLCYAICRAVRPAVVVETGVAYGVTSAFILQALEVNGHGALHSVDRPPFVRDVERFVGCLVPTALRGRWRLHRGVSGRLLPRLLPRLRRADVFVHDSRHTYRNIRRELRTVTPYLAPDGVVIADDVDRNRAFQEWATWARPSFWSTARQAEKGSLLGVGVFDGR